MNYASTNERENHDNDFPVMTDDDIADMVCNKPKEANMSEFQIKQQTADYIQYSTVYNPNPSVHDDIATKYGFGQDYRLACISSTPGWDMNVNGSADWVMERDDNSKAAEVARMEDLSDIERDALVEMASKRYHWPLWLPEGVWSKLDALGLVDMNNVDNPLTERGAALVAEYQQQQTQTPAAVDYTTSTGAKWGELSSSDQWYEYRTVRAELQAAREANAALKQAANISEGVISRLTNEQIIVKNHLASALQVESDTYKLSNLIHAVRVLANTNLSTAREWLEDTLALE